MYMWKYLGGKDQPWEGELIYNCVVTYRMMRLRIQLQMRRYSQERSREVRKAIAGYLIPTPLTGPELGRGRYPATPNLRLKANDTRSQF